MRLDLVILIFYFPFQNMRYVDQAQMSYGSSTEDTETTYGSSTEETTGKAFFLVTLYVSNTYIPSPPSNFTLM